MINTIPNQITFGRFILTLVMYVLLGMLDSSPGGSDTHLAKWAFIVFTVAAVTDFLDGYVARQMNQVTPLGRILDPFVDKLLVCGAMVFLCSMPRTREFLPSWIVVVVILREFFVTGLRGLIEYQGKSFSADIFGKFKMGLQCVTVGVLLFHTAWGGAGLETKQQNEWSALVSHVLVWSMLVATIASGIVYAFKARGKLSLEKLP